MDDVVKMGQVYRKDYLDGTYVKMAILGVDSNHIVSRVLESTNPYREKDWVGVMCLAGHDAFARKTNGFGWVLIKDENWLETITHIKECSDGI